jgi:hypothetical protein
MECRSVHEKARSVVSGLSVLRFDQADDDVRLIGRLAEAVEGGNHRLSHDGKVGVERGGELCGLGQSHVARSSGPRFAVGSDQQFSVVADFE